MKKLRQEFADTMLEVGVVDPRLVVMVGDISHGILQPFAKACPNRYYNIGICEPTIVNMAAGLSKAGLIPVVHTIAPFITERAYEQIKLDFGYQQLAVNIISVGGSFDYSQLGCSHHCYTDVSLICHLQRGVVVIPGSSVEFNKLFKDNYQNGAINYFRLVDNPHGVEFDPSDIVLGKGIRLREGTDVTLVVSGSQLKTALEVVERMRAIDVSVEVLYFHTIKPFDYALVHQSVSKTRKLVVAEELSKHDGLFNFCLRSCVGIGDLAFRHIAVEDFIYGYGTYEELCHGLGLDAEGLGRAVMELFNSCTKPIRSYESI
jgi:transketolase